MRERGFTLLEVMIGLALLGLALTVLIKSAAGSIFNAEQAHMIGVATDLARGKMYDIEETLLKDGFTDTDQSHESEECFKDEGWPNICYSYKVEQPKLPSFDELTQMAQGKAKKDAKAAAVAAGSGSGKGSGLLIDKSVLDKNGIPSPTALGSAASGGGLGNSMLGSMLGMFGGSTGVDAAAGGSMIQSQYSMFQEVLKVAVRKVTLNMKWTVLGSKREMKIVAFFTDPSAMNKTMLGQTTNALEAQGAGAGSATSTKTGTGTTPGTGKGSGK